MNPWLSDVGAMQAFKTAEWVIIFSLDFVSAQVKTHAPYIIYNNSGANLLYIHPVIPVASSLIQQITLK